MVMHMKANVMGEHLTAPEVGQEQILGLHCHSGSGSLNLPVLARVPK